MATDVHVIEDIHYICFQAALGVVFIFTCSSPSRQPSVVSLLVSPAVFAHLSSVRLLFFLAGLSYFTFIRVLKLLRYPIYYCFLFGASIASRRSTWQTFLGGVSLCINRQFKIQMRDNGRWQQKFMSSKIFVISFSGSSESGPLGVVFIFMCSSPPPKSSVVSLFGSPAVFARLSLASVPF